MMTTNLLILLLVGIFISIATSYIGSFMVLKRMSLVGDALSHVALPGIALALMFHLSPMIGAFVALIIAVIGVWYFEKTSKIYPEALVGIFFTFALAIGILITPEPDIFEALFGSIEKITFWEGMTAVVFSLIIISVTYFISKKLLLGTISVELAKSLKVQTDKVNLLYLLMVGGIVSLGVRFIGTLLMGALVIIPAASAKNITSNIKSYYFLSIIFGIISATAGIVISNNFNLPTGPIVVLASIVIFVATYFLKNTYFKEQSASTC